MPLTPTSVSETKESHAYVVGSHSGLSTEVVISIAATTGQSGLPRIYVSMNVTPMDNESTATATELEELLTTVRGSSQDLATRLSKVLSLIKFQSDTRSKT